MFERLCAESLGQHLLREADLSHDLLLLFLLPLFEGTVGLKGAADVRGVTLLVVKLLPGDALLGAVTLIRHEAVEVAIGVLVQR